MEWKLVGQRLDALWRKRFMWAQERVKRKLVDELGLETGPGAPVPGASVGGGHVQRWWRGVGHGRVSAQRWMQRGVTMKVAARLPEGQRANLQETTRGGMEETTEILGEG